MVKFEVLKKSQSLMSLLGIYSYRLTEPTNEFFKSPIALHILVTLISTQMISSGLFVSKNLEQFTMAIDGLLVCIAGTQSSGMFFSIGLKMKKIKLLHLKLQDIVDAVVSSMFHFSPLFSFSPKLN